MNSTDAHDEADAVGGGLYNAVTTDFVVLAERVVAVPDTLGSHE